MWTSRLAKNLEECRQAKHGRFKTPGCKGLKMVVTLCVLCYNKVSRAVSRKIMVHSTRVHSLPPKKPTAGYTVLCILWYAIIIGGEKNKYIKAPVFLYLKKKNRVTS